MKKAIQSKGAPAAIGTYSQAVHAGDAVYLSGTTIDYKTGATSGFLFNNPNSRAEPPE